MSAFPTDIKHVDSRPIAAEAQRRARELADREGASGGAAAVDRGFGDNDSWCGPDEPGPVVKLDTCGECKRPVSGPEAHVDDLCSGVAAGGPGSIEVHGWSDQGAGIGYAALRRVHVVGGASVPAAVQIHLGDSHGRQLLLVLSPGDALSLAERLSRLGSEAHELNRERTMGQGALIKGGA